MSFRMYEPDKKSKFFLYVVFFSSVLIIVVIYVFSRPLAVESACSDVTEKTSGLTNSFNYDPLSDYNVQKAKCMDDVLSKKND